MESKPAAKAEVNVRVAVRVRPFVTKEKLQRRVEAVRVFSDRKQVLIGKDKSFTFDHAFGPSTRQAEIYETCVESLVGACFEGYNATVFAYGQTGSGKTYTMGSGNLEGLEEEAIGIIPRAVRQIFDTMEDRRAECEFLVRVSYLEIYMEELRDLLEPEKPSRAMSIRENGAGDTVLVGVAEEVVNSAEEVFRYLESGSLARVTGSTAMNEQSSRSHAIFTIIIEQRRRHAPTDGGEGDAPGKSEEYLSSKFHLVDLAGSERAHRTKNAGNAFKETVTINSGLLVLGKVISALADAPARRALSAGHVPYRDSKLTRILKDSLGGNSRTAMIACLSPADVDMEESLSSLKYANRARNIKNRPIVNTSPEEALLAEMRHEIDVLRTQLREQQRQHESLRAEHEGRQREALERHERSVREEVARKLSSAGLTVSTVFETNAHAIDGVVGELKARTIRGANVARDLAQANEKAAALQERAERAELEASRLRAALVIADQKFERVAKRSEATRALVKRCQRHLVTLMRAGGKRAASGGEENADPEGLGRLLAEISELLSSPDDASTAAIVGGGRSFGRPVTAIPTQAENVGGVEHERVVAQLREELLQTQNALAVSRREVAEIRSDLMRDDEIFADKLKEIRKLQRHNERLEGLLVSRGGELPLSVAASMVLAARPQTAHTRSLMHSVVGPPGTGDVQRLVIEHPPRTGTSEREQHHTRPSTAVHAPAAIVEEAQTSQADTPSTDTGRHLPQQQRRAPPRTAEPSTRPLESGARPAPPPTAPPQLVRVAEETPSTHTPQHAQVQSLAQQQQSVGASPRAVSTTASRQGIRSSLAKFGMAPDASDTPSYAAETRMAAESPSLQSSAVQIPLSGTANAPSRPHTGAQVQSSSRRVPGVQSTVQGGVAATADVGHASMSARAQSAVLPRRGHSALGVEGNGGPPRTPRRANSPSSAAVMSSQRARPATTSAAIEALTRESSVLSPHSIAGSERSCSQLLAWEMEDRDDAVAPVGSDDDFADGDAELSSDSMEGV